ncbi:MAG TPA: zinc ribbon domain-containing protein [Polyangiaceae bacterium]|nr:zinc ribbon domain-containing protein [Polyangiaceae bacterium]
MASQPFTRNYTDHSNDQGFQFEFFCDKCGSGYRSEFQRNSLGFAAQMIKAAGSLFGGEVARAGWGADQLKDAFRGPAWDAAYKHAIEECKPKLRQCTKCGQWVCPEVCWNHERGLCENCAPDLAEHAAAAQAQVAVEQAWEQARNADQMRGFDVQKQKLSAPATCGKCQASLAPNAKFCAGCGNPVTNAASGPKFCSGCGTQLQAGARFCQSCGAGV